MSHDKKEVFLIDGSSYIHRAYHAIRALSNSRGVPTNAVFGFTKMLLKVLREKDPSGVAVVFDARGPTFRHGIYPQYKANRPPMPDDLAMQIPFIKRIVGLLNIACLEKEGYEADDIIGTLAKRLSLEGRRVVMVTGDKDFRQVVSPLVFIWDSMKDKVIDYDEIKKTYGIEPAAFVDVMALSGDSGDNIPGVPGIGEKTALELIREFGSLDALLDGLDMIKKRNLAARIAGYREQLLMSRRLVTIDCEVPLDRKISFAVGSPERDELASLFRELEFKSLWEEFAPQKNTASDCTLCLTLDSLGRWLEGARESGILAISLETEGKGDAAGEPVGISMAAPGAGACHVPFPRAWEGPSGKDAFNGLLGLLKERLENKYIKKVGHDLKSQARVLAAKGIELGGIFFDTMLASYVINPGLKDHSLPNLAGRYLGERIYSGYEEALKAGGAKEGESSRLEEIARYGCAWSGAALRLKQKLEERLRRDGNEGLFHDLEMRLLPVLLQMETAGIGIDIQYLRRLSSEFEVRAQRLAAEIYEKAGASFNINSPRQLSEVLFDRLGLPSQRRTAKRGNQATGYEILRGLSGLHPVPGLVLQYRTVTKLKSTYMDGLLALAEPATGRLHTTFNQAVTATGRLSSSNPNLQNIPSRGEEGSLIRKAFTARQGFRLMSADYSQVELRIFAHYSGDRGLIEAFARGEDIHRRTASDILKVPQDDVTPEMRNIAKAINFGIIYGMGAQRLSRELEMDLAVAKDYISAYYERYPGVLRYREEMIKRAREQGYVTTLLNRRRYLPEINNKNGAVRSEAERMAVNTPIQGTAADIIKKAMVAVHQELDARGLASRMLLQVHDELVFEVPAVELDEAAKLARAIMERAVTLDVPLAVDIKHGNNWAEAH